MFFLKNSNRNTSRILSNTSSRPSHPTPSSKKQQKKAFSLFHLLKNGKVVLMCRASWLSLLAIVTRLFFSPT